MEDLQAKIEYLKRNYSGPGILSGTDILTGKYYTSMRICDHEHFWKAHLLGPGRGVAPAVVVARDEEGQRCQVESYFRPMARCLDQKRTTSVISIQLRGQHGLEPPDAVRQVCHCLAERGVRPVIERSFRIGVWVLHVLMSVPTDGDRAKRLCYEWYCHIRESTGLSDGSITAPLLDTGCETLYVPMQFFSGEWFGQLYVLNEDGLERLDFSRVPHLDVETMKMAELSFMESPRGKEMESLVAAWWTRHGSRRVRAGELYALAEQDGISLNSTLSSGIKHKRICDLGRHLQQLQGNKAGGYIIHAKPSGNGTVFWLSDAKSMLYG
jgi:hypothetical protein